MTGDARGISPPSQADAVRIIVSGSFPDRMNSNLVLRRYLTRGLQQCLGERAVLDVPLHSLVPAVALHKPELVLCFGSCPPEVTNFAPLRSACDRASSHLAFWLHDDPYEFDLNYSASDIADSLFTNDSWAALHYDHPRTFHLPLAADEPSHYRKWIEQKDFDVFFCGVGFANRVRLLKDLAPVLARCRTAILGDGWPAELSVAVNQRIPNSELVDRSARSVATLYMGRNFHFSNHRFQLDPSTPGPRFFEAAMTGAVQLVFADTLEVLDYFAPGEGIILYDDPTGFERQLGRLREDPAYAKSVAQAGQARALRDHTYAARARTLLDTCGIR